MEGLISVNKLTSLPSGEQEKEQATLLLPFGAFKRTAAARHLDVAALDSTSLCFLPLVQDSLRIQCS
jgi:hypothetical protein